MFFGIFEQSVLKYRPNEKKIEFYNSVDAIRSQNNNNINYMHCTMQYAPYFAIKFRKSTFGQVN